MLAPYVVKHQQLVLQDTPAADTDIKRALQIYKYFHQLTRQPTWGDVPIRCTSSCKVCFPNCVCRCTLLFESLFDPAVHIPAEYIAATVSGSKRCKSIKDTAGRKRLCIIAENRCNKKKIDSKVGNMIGTKPCKSPMREPELGVQKVSLPRAWRRSLQRKRRYAP
jgi:hypothetical protein